MIEIFQFMARFCFWFLLAMVLLFFSALGLWTFITLLQAMRHRK